MSKEKIIVIGANGQIGTALVSKLRQLHGNDNIIATDIRKPENQSETDENFELLDVLNQERVNEIFSKYHPTQVYLLAAMLSATGEKFPKKAWDLNMQGLFNVFDLALEHKVKKVFWPSSIAVFGPNSPKENTPQHCIMEPNTVYGISKQAGERWCEYYKAKYGLDVRSVRYPGLIGWEAEPGGGTTDYAVDIFYEALKNKTFTCFLLEDTRLPMMSMPDAIRATIELMEAPKKDLSIRSGYNIAGMSFSPKEIAEEIKKHIPDFTINYTEKDPRQAIADSWPKSIDDSIAQNDWGWQPEHNLQALVKAMLENIKINEPAS